ncbi:MAG: hypothetical protein KDK48_00470, partial [Chlamydiia bacterium]|nr:hypothetical protein [Chlamydiia bacterium]
MRVGFCDDGKARALYRFQGFLKRGASACAARMLIAAAPHTLACEPDVGLSFGLEKILFNFGHHLFHTLGFCQEGARIKSRMSRSTWGGLGTGLNGVDA